MQHMFALPKECSTNILCLSEQRPGPLFCFRRFDPAIIRAQPLWNMHFRFYWSNQRYNIINRWIMTYHASVQTCNSYSQPPHGARTAAAFPLCMASDVHYRRYSQLLGSPVISRRHCPSSPLNSSAASPGTPGISTCSKGHKEVVQVEMCILGHHRP